MKKREIIRIIQTSTTSLLMLTLMFLVIEPAISNAVVSQSTQTLTITSEISFLTPASNIVLTPSLAGITGGTATGATQVRVLTNNSTGYNMTIMASSSLGMIGQTSALAGIIPAYTPVVAGNPDYNFSASSTQARFGYNVLASTTSDVSAAFKSSGASCGSGTADGIHCWINASTTQYQIINRSTPTPDSGATTTINFKVIIASNPSPAIPQDTYVSTTTLTALVNP